MAQMGNIRPFEKPAVELFLDEQGRYSSPMTPPLVRGYDHEDDQSPHTKKSVLAKVKEKAKKWRSTLGKKKHGHDGASPTPSLGVRLEEENEEEAPEYHGAPMYQSSQAPEDYKGTVPQHPVPPVVIAERHVLKAKNMEKTTVSKAATQSAAKDMSGPASDVVSETTQVINSKTQGPPAEEATATATASDESSSSCTGQNWDKGVSVKEYLMQKLEPGEEVRALSQVISEAMSPSKAGDHGEMGVVDKVKEAVSSLLGIEEQPPPKVTVTINPHAEIIEEKEERILQTN